MSLFKSNKKVVDELTAKLDAINKTQAVIEFNMDGTIITANDNFCQTMGYELNEIQGQHHSIFAEESFKVSNEYKQFWEKLNSGVYETAEYKRIGKGGKEVWINASYNPIFDLNGKPYKVVKYATDVTDQKLQAVKNYRTTSALDVCQANVMMADADLKIIYLNNAVKTMLKKRENEIRQVLPSFSVETLIGTNIDDFHKKPEHQRGMLNKLTSTYKTSIEVASMTFTLTATPVVNEQGERLGTVVEWADRTDELAIEVEIGELVKGAVEGDLSRRIDISDKSGFFEVLGNGLNDLVNVAEDVVINTADVLEAMSRGDLTKSIEADYKGTFGKLKNDANATVNKLTEIITEIRSSASSVASGAQEISGGNLDLSQRTEQQASSLEETAASMEEMTASVRLSADNAKSASGLAEEAQKTAESGGEVVGRAVEAMSAINDSSNKISDIIGVIDEIAFQTNLLALNAAVEAARAGEQGRGFAVVAAEVRNLAQRSAGAAKEIKELIRDSVAKVEDGSKLVNESGDTLREIVNAVQQVNSIIAEISSSAREQSDGIDQVNTAITQMDEATQQNAALVEEASAASENMAEQAGLMNELMDFFTTDSSAVAQVVHTPIEAKADTTKVNTFNTKKVVTQENSEGWEEF